VIKYHPDKTQDISTTFEFQLLTTCYKKLLKQLADRKHDAHFHDQRQASLSFTKKQDNLKPVNVNDTKTKFDVDKFNAMFADNKIPDFAIDNGYGEWMNDPKSFSEQKASHKALQKYREPQPAESSQLGYYDLGVESIKDYSGATSIDFMDYRIAYTMSTLDVDKVKKRQQFKDINDLEKARSNVRFEMSEKEIEAYQRRQIREDMVEKKRIEQLKQRDDMIEMQHGRVNALMLNMR
jgi:hypothetical protein